MEMRSVKREKRLKCCGDRRLRSSVGYDRPRNPHPSTVNRIRVPSPRVRQGRIDEHSRRVNQSLVVQHPSTHPVAEPRRLHTERARYRLRATSQRAIILGLVLVACSDSIGPGPTGDPLTTGVYDFFYIDGNTTYSGILEVTLVATGDSATIELDTSTPFSSARIGLPGIPVGGFYLGAELGDDVVPRYFFAPRRYIFDDFVSRYRVVGTYIVHLSAHAPDGNFCYFGNNFTAERFATECRVEKR